MKLPSNDDNGLEGDCLERGVDLLTKTWYELVLGDVEFLKPV